METKRIEYLDAIKGFAILLMVMGHSIAWNYPCWQDVLPINGGAQNFKDGIVWNFIYAFHMATFFFVSGYLSYKENSDLRASLIQKTRRLLIPYIITGALIIPFRGYFGYWFLFSLWQLSIIGCLFNRYLPKPTLKKGKQFLMDIAIICIGFLICKYVFSDRFMDNPFCEQDKFVGYYFPFMGGVIMRKYECINKWVQSHFAVCFVGFVIFFTNRYLSFEQGSLQVVQSVINHVGYYLMPVLGTLAVWEIFRRGIKPCIQHFFAIIGRHTFEIYIFHIFFLIQIPSVGVFWMNSNLYTCLTTQILYSFLCSVFAILLAICVAIPIQQSTWLNRLILGAK